ncbi:MAG: SDR family oxidoreductase, partial [Deltaproteobacteria bacterium]|nr:SDR family oxidoreductase [Deltaproteobacteria bacterium]
MRIVVTGANGLVGARIVHRAAERHQVVAVGRGAPRFGRPRGDVRYVALDLEDADAIEALVRSERPAAVLHAAAMTDVDACESAPERARRVNVVTVAAVARGCKAIAARLVALSTDYVFDGAAGPYAEDDAPSPRGVYATTKRDGELAALEGAPRAVVARTAVIYSGRRTARRTFALATVESLRAGKTVKAFLDQRVSPTLADNSAGMCLAALESGYDGILHCAGATVMTRVAFCHALCERLDASK